MRRVVPAFERTITASPGVSIIVAHAGVNRILLCHFLGMPLNKLFYLGQDEAAVNIIDEGPGGKVVRAVNAAIALR